MSTHSDTARARIGASLVLAVAASLLASCATTGSHALGTAIPVSREVLPMDENTARYPDVYAAIEHLRPEFLTVREQGSTSMVPVAYLNGVRLADPEMLQLIPVSWVLEVRWVRPNQTSSLYGSRQHLGGGIFVSTRERGAQ